MDHATLLVEAYGRLPELARGAVDGLEPGDLLFAPTEESNTIAWLIWHATRVQDHHVSELLEDRQLWLTGDWPSRFGLAADPDNTGYGHRPDQVRAVVPRGADDLVAYLDAVQARTLPWLASLSGDDLDAIVDTRWVPPVTLGVRLVSVADDSFQHLGQAAYLRGLLGR